MCSVVVLATYSRNTSSAIASLSKSGFAMLKFQTLFYRYRLIVVAITYGLIDDDKLILEL